MSEPELRAKVMAQRRYIDVLVEVERQRGRARSSDRLMPTPLAPAPPPAPPAVHVLLYGSAPCGSVYGTPRDWPEGHKWVRVDELEKATCDGCKAILYATRAT